MSILHRELCGSISVLQTYEYSIFGSPHRITVFCNYKTLFHCRAQKSRLSHRFFRYEVINTQITTLQIIWIPGRKLTFPVLLSKNVSLKLLNCHQLAHKRFLKKIRFLNCNGQDFHYVNTRNSSTDGNDDFQPVVSKHLGETKALQFEKYGTHTIFTIFDSKFP